MNKFKLHPGLGSQVVDLLAQIAKLPLKGIVAGGAVQAIVCKMANHSNIHINDIDVFMSIDQYAPKKGENAILVKSSDKKAETVGLSSEVQMINPYSGMFTHIDLVKRYELLKTFRKGMVNFVIYKSPWFNIKAPTEGISPHLLLDGFDLNCTQVAVDLETKKLFWTKGFEFYLQNHELRVVNCHTPGHTAIRFLQKLHTLQDVYGNVEESMEILSGVISLSQQSDYYGFVANRFGEGYLDKLKTYGDGLSKYFTLESNDGLNTLTPRFGPCSDVEAILKKFGRYSVKALAAGYYEVTRQKKIGFLDFQSKVHLDENTDVSSFIRENLFLESIVPSRFYSSSVSLNKYRQFMRFYEHAGHRPAYYGLFLGMTMKEQLQAYDNVLRLERELGDWVQGCLFSQIISIKTSSSELLNIEALKETLIKKKQQLDSRKNIFKINFDEKEILKGLPEGLKVRFINFDSVGDSLSLYKFNTYFSNRIKSNPYSNSSTTISFMIEVERENGKVDRTVAQLYLNSSSNNLHNPVFQLFPRKDGKENGELLKFYYDVEKTPVACNKFLGTFYNTSKGKASKLGEHLANKALESVRWSLDDCKANKPVIIENLRKLIKSRKVQAFKIFHDFIENNSLNKYFRELYPRDLDWESSQIITFLYNIEISESVIEEFRSAELKLREKLKRLEMLTTHLHRSNRTGFYIGSDRETRADFIQKSAMEVANGDKFSELLLSNDYAFSLNTSLELTIGHSEEYLDDAIPF